MSATLPLHAPPHPPHRRAAIGVAVLVLGLHAWLLQALAPQGLRADAAAAARHAATPTLQVRQLMREAPPVVVAPALRGPVAAAAAPRSAVAEVIDVAAPPSEAVETPAEAPAPATPTVPLYATRLAPAATLQFTLRRGAHQGQAELRWAPAADGTRYQLALHSRIDGRPPLGRNSEGQLDAHGLGPERYTESARGRERRAVNFQPAAGRISFSGPTQQLPWLAGAQDRLSWMLQLGAVVAADPTLAQAGRQFELFVAGARGDAEVWVFEMLGTQALELPDGTQVDAVVARREPRRPYDTRAEIWLDPARHHLPLRALLTLRATGERSELLLQALHLQ